MSYIRGDYYVWADDSHVHIWARDGYDNWDGSVWNEGSGERNPERRPSGVALPFEVADELAVMRIAELTEAGQLTDTIKRTLEKWKGNGGCFALTQVGERMSRMNYSARR